MNEHQTPYNRVQYRPPVLDDLMLGETRNRLGLIAQGMGQWQDSEFLRGIIAGLLLRLGAREEARRLALKTPQPHPDSALDPSPPKQYTPSADLMPVYCDDDGNLHAYRARPGEFDRVCPSCNGSGIDDTARLYAPPCFSCGGSGGVA